MNESHLSNVPGYAEVQKETMALSSAIAAEAYTNKDIPVLRALVEDVKTVRDFTIAAINNQYDFDTWVTGQNRVNAESQFAALDTTGRLKNVMDRLAELDARAYYEADVVPALKTDPAVVQRDMDLLITSIEGAISDLENGII